METPEPTVKEEEKPATVTAKIKARSYQTEYHCVECCKELENRVGCLYHPKTRRSFFTLVPINCKFAGMYFEHPDIWEMPQVFPRNGGTPDDI